MFGMNLTIYLVGILRLHFIVVIDATNCTSKELRYVKRVSNVCINRIQIVKNTEGGRP